MVLHPVNKRIKDIVTTVFGGNTAAAARTAKLNRSTLQTLFGPQGTRPSYDVLNAIVENTTPKINAEWLLTGRGPMFAQDAQAYREMRPHIDILAVKGGSLSEYVGSAGDGVTMHPLVEAFSDYDLSIQLIGDSMEPRYFQGDTLFCKEYPMDAIRWGETYVLDTMGGPLLKRVYEQDVDNFRLVSYNGEEYPPQIVPKADIIKVYRVRGILRPA